jgi:hypothetical protein
MVFRKLTHLTRIYPYAFTEHNKRKYLKEAKKCVLLCVNCHRGLHAGLIEIPAAYAAIAA